MFQKDLYQMNIANLISLLVCVSLACPSSKGTAEWIKKKGLSFDMNYTAADSDFISEYKDLITDGRRTVISFFNLSYENKFDVFVHPDRSSLDSTWSHDWKMTGFKSECWMVASGVATRIDLISPHQWNKYSCEHTYDDKIKRQQLITHELVHVFHGQHNSSGDFSNVVNIDWFVEGLAAYASGQVDTTVLARVKKAVNDKTIPSTLDKFWTGSLRYGLSGSVVMYIDKKYGRTVLKMLLACKTKEEIFRLLKVSEKDLLEGWEAMITGNL